MKKNNFIQFGDLAMDEYAIITSITFTFVFYLFGALYLVAPILGWALMLHLTLRWVMGGNCYSGNLKWLIVLWLAGACLLELSLILGHLDFDLGLGKIIKSTIGWAKGWALLSIFIVLGYCLNIRSETICRAACVVGLSAMIILPFLILAYLLNLPGHLYVSPLKVLGGSGPEFFTVILYEIDPFSGTPRWRFFAPWAPAVGFVANIYFMCAWFEKDPKWRCYGLLGNALMILLAVSRMGILVMCIVPLAVWCISRLQRSSMLLLVCAVIILGAIFADPIIHTLSTAIDTLKEARADSTRVRAALGNIALHRWHSEAFWFGHGVVEAGTHLVEFMPIGSHHNWYGLLFVKGVIGLAAFAIPFIITLMILLVKAQFSHQARLALGVMLIITCFSFSENIEALAYMTWPAWLLIGVGLKDSQNIAKKELNPLIYSKYRLKETILGGTL